MPLSVFYLSLLVHFWDLFFLFEGGLYYLRRLYFSRCPHFQCPYFWIHLFFQSFLLFQVLFIFKGVFAFYIIFIFKNSATQDIQLLYVIYLCGVALPNKRNRPLHLPFSGLLYFEVYFRGCLYFCGCLYFWGCFHFWSNLH